MNDLSLAYSAIEISNFRAIKHLVINDLSNINIITGRNNAGKSSCLEAIALLASGNSSFKNAFGEDILKFITFRRTPSELSWNYLIHHGSDKASILGFRGKKTEGTIIGKSIDQVNLGPNDDLVRDLSSQLEQKSSNERELVTYYTRERRTFPVIKNKLFFYFSNGYECLAELYEAGDERDVIRTSKKKTDSKLAKNEVIFISNFEKIQNE